MSQITLYLDDVTQALVDQAAQASRVFTAAKSPFHGNLRA